MILTLEVSGKRDCIWKERSLNGQKCTHKGQRGLAKSVHIRTEAKVYDS